MNYKFHIIFFIAVYILVFLFTYVLDLIKIRKRKKSKIGEISYLVTKFKLDKNKLNYKKISFDIAIINGFIISLTTTIVALVDVALTIQLLLGFVLLFALIYSLYEIYGRHLKNKEERMINKNKKKKGSN